MLGKTHPSVQSSHMKLQLSHLSKNFIVCDLPPIQTGTIILTLFMKMLQVLVNSYLSTLLNCYFKLSISAVSSPTWDFSSQFSLVAASKANEVIFCKLSEFIRHCIHLSFVEADLLLQFFILICKESHPQLCFSMPTLTALVTSSVAEASAFNPFTSTSTLIAIGRITYSTFVAFSCRFGH